MFHGALAALRQKGRNIFQGSHVTPLLTLTQCVTQQRNLVPHPCSQFDKLLLEEADVEAIAAVAGLLVETDLRMCGSR